MLRNVVTEDPGLLETAQAEPTGSESRPQGPSI